MTNTTVGCETNFSDGKKSIKRCVSTLSNNFSRAETVKKISDVLQIRIFNMSDVSLSAEVSEIHTLVGGRPVTDENRA